MNPKEKDITVFVVAGEWEHVGNGGLDFVLSKEFFGRCLSMTEDMSYEDLASYVCAEFEMDPFSIKPKLSYWIPSDHSLLTVNRRPPVSITTTMGVKSFLSVKQNERHLNMMMSFDLLEMVDGDPTDGNQKDNRVLNRHYEVGNYSGSVRVGADVDQVDSRDGVIRMYSFSSEDGNCDVVNNAERRESRLVPTELWPPTNLDGIISLADGKSPSLSHNSECNVDQDVEQGGEASDSYAEDKEVLRQIEEIERKYEKDRLLGKGKGILQEVDTSSSDGYVGCDGDSDDGSYDYDFWTDLINQENQDSLGSPTEEGNKNGGGKEDISAAVLSYHRGDEGSFHGDSDGEEFIFVDGFVSSPTVDKVSHGVAPEASNAAFVHVRNEPEYMLEQGTLPPTDAQPVFDDDLEMGSGDGFASASTEDDAIYIGRVYKDKKHMQNTLAIYAIKRQFHFRQTRSDPTRLIFVCVDRRCAWRVFGKVMSEKSANFEVRTMTLTHTCTIAARSQYGKQASAKVIAEVLKDKFANDQRGPRPVDIPDIVLAELKVSVSYMKAWHAKEAALELSRGSEEGSFSLLPTYMHLLQETNPGTKYKIEYVKQRNGRKKFKYLFFAIGACIAGIKYQRRIILVDGTAISAKFKGVLLTCTMQDANLQVFPIAFAVVDGENIESWTWFFRHISLLIPDAEDLVIVSDRHRAIYAAVDIVYPKAFHGACAVHIERNVRGKFIGTGLSNLVGKAERAFNDSDFKGFFSEIERRSAKCAEYLKKIPLEHWTQAYFEAKRYNVMSSNVAEAWNGAIAKIVELPIVTMVEAIRLKLMKWYCLRRAEAAKKHYDLLTPNAQLWILRHHAKSAGLAVTRVSPWTYQVNTLEGKIYYVDLESKTCTCKQFQKLLIPCCHALAAARINGIHIPSLGGECYGIEIWRKQYVELIFPVPLGLEVDVPANIVEDDVAPPINPPGPGRRRNRRIPSTGEFTGSKRRKNTEHKCSRCLQAGHNRATCRGPLA